MKKAIMIIVGIVVLISCEKDCECITSYTGTGSTGILSTSETVEQFDSGNCGAMNSSTTDANGLITTVECN